MVELCDNCETYFCFNCDSDSGKCPKCGRPYCGECARKGETCACPPEED
jgi:hypothetical protein